MYKRLYFLNVIVAFYQNSIIILSTKTTSQACESPKISSRYFWIYKKQICIRVGSGSFLSATYLLTILKKIVN